MGLAACANRLGNHARYRRRRREGRFFSLKKKGKKRKKTRKMPRVYICIRCSQIIVRDFHFDSNIRGYLEIEMLKLGYDINASRPGYYIYISIYIYLRLPFEDFFFLNGRVLSRILSAIDAPCKIIEACR